MIVGVALVGAKLVRVLCQQLFGSDDPPRAARQSRVVGEVRIGKRKGGEKRNLMNDDAWEDEEEYLARL